MTEGLLISIPRRMTLVRTTLVSALLVSMLVGWRLWGGPRDFPYASLADGWAVNEATHRAMGIAAALLLLGSLVFRFQRLLLFLGLLVCTAMILLDVNRLQWWTYLYFGMLLVFVVYNGRVDDPNRYTSYFIILQIMFASVYFFSGWQQLNPLFVPLEFTRVIDPLHAVLSERQFGFFVRLGAGVPYLLMFTGIGLIVSPMRYLSITLGTLLHLILLVFLFRRGAGVDWQLWMTNLVFLFLLFVLFSGKTKQRYFSPALLFQRPFFYAALVFFAVMPFFNSSGRWPDALSFNIRSGNYETAVFYLPETTVRRLPVYVQSFCEPRGEAATLRYQDWALHELTTPCFRGLFAYEGIMRYLERHSSGDSLPQMDLVPRQPLLFKR